MTYLAEKPANTIAVREKQLVTIEFTPRTHPTETEYIYPHPTFTFGDRVSLTNEYPQTSYTVCALELIESKTPSGRLLAQPYWKYKVSNGEVCYWKEESAIFRLESASSSGRTCAECTYFQNYTEPEFFEIDGEKIANNNSGKGWCSQFNHQSRTHHRMTDDCVLNGSISPQPTSQTSEENLHLPNFHVGDIVKIIDSAEHHTEWGVFEIVEVVHNDKHFSSVENYLNTQEWHYKLVSYQRGDEAIIVGDGEICLANMSHNVCTQDII